MPIVGGLDVHRKQLTSGYPGTATGEPEPNFTRWGTTAASSRQSAVSRYRPCRAGPGGRPA